MGPSLALTALTTADTGFVARLATDERVMAYIGNGTTWSLEYTAQRVAHALEAEEISWFIAHRQNSPVGLFTATKRTYGTEIGYWIDPDYWGQGLAKAIVGEGIEGLKVAGHTALMARVEAGNSASLKVLISHGFIAQAQEGPGLITLTRADPAGSMPTTF